MSRPILHLVPTQPGLSTDGTARRLIEELGGQVTWVDLSPQFAGDPVEIARDPEDALSAALDAVQAAQGDLLVTTAQLPAALQPVAFTLQTRLAAELGAGMVLVVAAQDDVLERVARAEAEQGHAVVVGTRLAGGDWADSACNDASGYRILNGALPNGEVSQLRVDGDESIGEVLGQLADNTCLVVPADRAELLVGLTIAFAAGHRPLPKAVLLLGEVPESIPRTWRRFAPGIPLAQVAVNAETSTASQVIERARRAQIERPVTPLSFQRRLQADAQAVNQHIVLPEGTEPRIVRAAAEVLRLGGARLTLLGKPDAVREAAAAEGVDLGAATIIDPETDPLRDRFADEYAELRAKKGVTREQAYARVADVSYFGTMLVRDGLADGMVSGAVNTTAHTIRPAFEVIKTKPGVAVVSSLFFMCLPDRVLGFGDCAVNPNPTAEQLADIAAASAVTAAQFGLEPRVALLSYSTGTSGSGPDVDLVTEAAQLLEQKVPELCADGPLQFDAAVDETVGRSKAPDSPVAGRANVLIFPDLSAGNAAYKAVQRTAGALAVGPVLQGLNKPVNDLSRGALVEDIINTILITAIQAGREG